MLKILGHFCTFLVCAILLAVCSSVKISLIFQGNIVLVGRLQETAMQDLFAMAAWDFLILTFHMIHLDVLVHMDIIALQVSNYFSFFFFSSLVM